jgi:hypothetical protein
MDFHSLKNRLLLILSIRSIGNRRYQMPRLIYFVGLIALLPLAACSPAATTPVVLPTFLPPQVLATPEINQAYPTVQAIQSNTSLTVSGFTVNLQRAWRDGKQVYADLCYTLPDNSDWTVWNAHFDYAGQAVSEFSSAMLNKQDAKQSQAGIRCDELGFYVPPDADLSSASLTIQSLGAYPSQDEYCSLYLPKIQQALNERGVAITLNCVDVNGAKTMQITSKPNNMSQAEAEQMVYSDEFYTVSGPWTFPVTLGQ